MVPPPLFRKIYEGGRNPPHTSLWRSYYRVRTYLPHLLRPSGHLPPLGLCTLEMGVRHVQEKLQRSAARKAIEFAVVGIDPVQRAIRPDLCARRNSDGIETVEFARHGFW